ncbi:DUF1573 domain-containing protein [Membranihabitans maritimus]|uniref:DUF1573 domain-containing protein n=1 Tax=Membranihabitans maritimus TaxID=2904244 RepID=UPI001F2757E1|nr:DUF1573 domain-containing protein [Membranihabitans maritimus]
MKNNWLLIPFVLLALVSCNSGGDSDLRDQARESLENQTVVSPGAQGAMAAQTDEVSGPVTAITFESKKFDFGTAESGDKVKNVFKFTNTGDEPLVISNVKPSCGCTTPSWPKEPIAPGESGEIEAIFDTSGKSGAQTKSITVTANTDPSSSILILEGTVNK